MELVIKLLKCILALSKFFERLRSQQIDDWYSHNGSLKIKR